MGSLVPRSLGLATLIATQTHHKKLHGRCNFWVTFCTALEMRFGGNSIEGSNPSLSAITSRTKCHQSVVRDGLLIDAAMASAYLETRY